MKAFLPFLCLALLSSGAFAQSESLSQTRLLEGGRVRATVMYAGKYYRDAEIRIYGENSVTVYSEKDGRGEVPITALPPAMKTEVAAWKARRAKETAMPSSAAKPAKPTPVPGPELNATVVVSQRLDDGVLCRDGERTIKLTGHPREKELADGNQISVRAVPTGVFRYKTADGTTATVRAYQVTEAR